MSNKSNLYPNPARALKARVYWSYSRVPAFSGEERADFRETAEYIAWLDGYTSFPNQQVPALVADVPELCKQRVDGLLSSDYIRLLVVSMKPRFTYPPADYQKRIKEVLTKMVRGDRE